MMGPIDPCFEVTENTMDMRGHPMGSLGGANHPYPMFVTHKSVVGITAPAIRSKCRPGFDILSQKMTDTHLTGIVQGRKPKPPGTFTALPAFVFIRQHLDGTDHQGLVFGRRHTTTSLAFCRAADDRLIGFEQAGEAASVLVDHPLPESMQQMPGGCIAGIAQLPLDLDGADSRGVSRNQIGGPEPLLDGDVRTVHHGAGCGRGLVAAISAQKQCPSFQEGARLAGALWANETLRPPASNEIFQARFLSRKLLAERSKVPGILRSAHV
jgi:hypothetical protein